MLEEPGDSDSERGWAKTKREQGRPDGVCGERRRRLSLWVTGGVSLVQGKDKTFVSRFQPRPCRANT